MHVRDKLKKESGIFKSQVKSKLFHNEIFLRPNTINVEE